MYRFGVDVGGTFTDLVILDGETGRIRTVKVPSTPHDPSEAVLDAIRTAADEDGIAVDLAAVGQFTHAPRSPRIRSCRASAPAPGC